MINNERALLEKEITRPGNWVESEGEWKAVVERYSPGGDLLDGPVSH